MNLQRLLVLAVWSFAATGALGQWSITQVTDDDFGDYYPSNSGGKVAWLGRRGVETHVFVYDGSTVTQLTDGDRRRSTPAISGDNVAWSAYDSYGGPSQIMLYDGTTVAPLTDLDGFAGLVTKPLATGPYVVWQGGENSAVEDIYRYDGTTTTQIWSGYASTVKASGEYVAWIGMDSTGGNDAEVFLFDGSSVTQITHNDVEDRRLDLHQGRIAWETESEETWTAPDGGGEIPYYNVAYFDGTDVTQLTDNAKVDTGIAISDGGVVWRSLADPLSTDNDVYYFDGTNTQMIGSDARDLRIEGSRVCWAADGPTDKDLYVWESGVTTRIPNPGFNDVAPAMSGDTIAWVTDGSGYEDDEIFIAVVPEPATMSLLALGGLALLRRRSR